MGPILKVKVMICCICNNISNTEVIKAINFGKTKHQIVSQFGIGVRCGKCIPQLDKLIEQLKEKKND